MYPVVTTPTGRKLSTAVFIQGRRFDSGITLLPCTYLVHRRPDIYPEPGRFRPERFLERRYASHEYFPFGGGVRTCLGATLAPVEMKLVLAEICTRSRLAPAHDGPVRPVRHGTLLAPSNADEVRPGGLLRLSEGKRPVRNIRNETTLIGCSMRAASEGSGVPSAVGQGQSRLLSLYRTMVVARQLDDLEAKMTSGGEAFFHVSCSGHEGSAILDFSLIPEDWLHLHYRDKALMLARGVPPVMFFHSLLCNAASHSAGRQMSAHISDPARRILSTVGPVGNNALQAVGVASAIKAERSRPIVVCSIGDGTTQQGEVLEAIGEAVRSELPVLFWIEDNAYAISTRTRYKTFYSLPRWCGKAETFCGLPIHRLDGRDILLVRGTGGVHRRTGPSDSSSRHHRFRGRPALRSHEFR